MGDAETAFSTGEDDRAIAILSEVTKKAPSLPEPYSMLALIFDNKGHKMYALQLYALAASFTSRSIELWSKVSTLLLVTLLCCVLNFRLWMMFDRLPNMLLVFVNTVKLSML